MAALNIWAVGITAPADNKPPLVAIYRLRQMLTVDDALNLAAWIVALADPGGEKFAKLLEEVKKS